ncbi:hypothetical protein WICMUC_003374 [Wickerhamomyces mucosus]|uniref:ubiquitinyl hydrolase 1 n=1 Tax=Wickerhamomyces mucosus TaxID=1378264 RepID=A0A9P8PLH5_9ASCO|nr:hypothetical protein WICMUC_003374 [Wickerhamomyces mucosus]
MKIPISDTNTVLQTAGSNNPFFNNANDNESVSKTNNNPFYLNDEQPNETPISNQIRVIDKLYHKVTTGIFKTSNRIIDDVRVSLTLLKESSKHDTILKTHPIEYSKGISDLKHNPYDIYVLDRTKLQSAVEKRRSFSNPKDEITVLRGLIFSSSHSQLSKLEIYHLKISIKVKDETKNIDANKHEFHLVNDDELYHEDRLDLISSIMIDENQKNFDIAKKSLPELIDSGTFVCSITNKILRVEISKPEFSYDDLHDFEIGPINVRFKNAITKGVVNDNDKIPSPSECLNTLYKALRGPLQKENTDEVQTIPAGHKSLATNINTRILLKNALFELDDGKFVPPNFSNYNHNYNSLIVRESYIRKLSETVLLGTKAFSSGRSNPFEGFKFTKDLHVIFHELHDNASIKHHHELLKDINYINLSTFPFYSDELIITCYNKTVETDPKNLPRYFDSLKDISVKRSNLKLSNFISTLASNNIIGQRDIDNAYRSLALDPPDGVLLADDSIISIYQTETLAHPSDTTYKKALSLLANVRKSSRIQRFLKYEPLPLSLAYETLDVEPVVDDDVISTAVIIKKADSPSQHELFDRAFITIASERKSFELLDKVEREFPDINDSIDIETARQLLAVDKDASDLQIVENFKNVQVTGQLEIKKARQALRTIGDHNNSKLIKSFLQTGFIDPKSLPADEWPVGLNNIGNTCYLNSLLQYYFSIKPLRDEILQFNEVFTNQEIYLNRRIGGRLVGEAEVNRSFQFTYQLRDLFKELINSEFRCITPKKELAYLAFLPSVNEVDFNSAEVLLDIPSQDDDVEVINIDDIDDDSDPKSDFIDLTSDTEIGDEREELETPEEPQDDLKEEESDITTDSHDDKENQKILESESLIVEHSDTTREDFAIHQPIPQSAKISQAEMETAYEIGRQQDVTECIGNVLSQVEAAFQPDKFDSEDQDQIDLVKRLFYGKTVQHLIDISDPSNKRAKKDRFQTLFVNIADKPRNLYEAIDLNFQTEQVEIDGGLFKRFERVIELPIILQIQIQRVYFDRELLRPYKSIEPLPFPETIYMDRYIDTTDQEILHKRSEVLEWRTKINELKSRQSYLLTKDPHGLSYKDSLQSTRDWLKEMELGSEKLIKSLDEQISQINVELSEIYSEIISLEKKIDHQFDGFQKIGYSIFAIFIHRGEANYGHYWIYIKDSNTGIFRKYNDETVSEVPSSTIFNFEETNSATPYFLGYIKQGYEDQIEPLFRNIQCD